MEPPKHAAFILPRWARQRALGAVSCFSSIFTSSRSHSSHAYEVGSLLLGVYSDKMLSFTCHCDCNLLVIINLITYFLRHECSYTHLFGKYFYFFESFRFLDIGLIQSRLEYASIAWNNLTLTELSKIENAQIKFTDLCCNSFYQSDFFS